MLRHLRPHLAALSTMALVSCDGCPTPSGPHSEPDPANQAPTVTVTSPAENAQFAVFTPITFTATATDPEEGTILVHWSAPNLGYSTSTQIGTGPSFTLDTAIVGQTELLAWVQDIGGNQRGATRKVQVVFGGEIAYDITETELRRSDGITTTSLPAGGKPAWSPNGQQIAFVKSDGHDREIFVMNADGTGTPTQVTNNTGDDDTPAWAPDGLRLAYDSDSTGNREIFFKVLATGAVTRVTTNSGSDEEPAWCGTDILFQSDRDGDHEIYKQGNLLSAPPQQLTVNTGRGDTDAHWSLDCSVIIYTHEESNGNGDVYLMNPNGTGATNLTNNPANDRQPELSPNKQIVVFRSDRLGGDRLWFLQTLPPSKVRPWIQPGSLAGHPRWKP